MICKYWGYIPLLLPYYNKQKMIKLLRQNFLKWLIQLVVAAEKLIEKEEAVPLIILCENTIFQKIIKCLINIAGMGNILCCYM